MNKFCNQDKKDLPQNVFSFISETEGAIPKSESGTVMKRCHGHRELLGADFLPPHDQADVSGVDPKFKLSENQTPPHPPLTCVYRFLKCASQVDPFLLKLIL